MKKIEKEIAWLVKNWDKVPERFKENWKHGEALIAGATESEHEVVVLISGQKPSVEADYSFDEQRIGIAKTGRVIWGFDSGCSCPDPWHDEYPQCFSCAETWKTFETEISSFDGDIIAECQKVIDEIRKTI